MTRMRRGASASDLARVESVAYEVVDPPLARGSDERRRLWTALAVVAVFVGAWLGIAKLIEQRDEIAALQREVGTLDIVVAGLRGAGPRGYALREPDRVYKRPWYRHRNAWRWERSARAGVRWGWGLKRLVELELQAPSRWGQACAALAGRARLPLSLIHI